MADEPDDVVDETDEDRFERWYQERVQRDEAKRNRNKEPKNFGEYLDRVADAVLDRIEERSEARRRERDEADQPPARGQASSKFAQWWSGGERDAG